MFAELDQERYHTNEGRRKNKKDLFAGIESITMKHSSADISKVLAEAAIPYSPITPIEKVAELPFVAETALRTKTPAGSTVRMPPPAQLTPHLEKLNGELPFAPAYGEHTNNILEEIGLSTTEITSLKEQGIVV
jgi:crotonobetainyl-CoA:carnitine CoA-transferase CaiB-like acyl-CoA transferase